MNSLTFLIWVTRQNLQWFEPRYFIEIQQTLFTRVDAALDWFRNQPGKFTHIRAGPVLLRLVVVVVEFLCYYWGLVSLSSLYTGTFHYCPLSTVHWAMDTTGLDNSLALINYVLRSVMFIFCYLLNWSCLDRQTGLVNNVVKTRHAIFLKIESNQ